MADGALSDVDVDRLALKKELTRAEEEALVDWFIGMECEIAADFGHESLFKRPTRARADAARVKRTRSRIRES